MKEIVIGALVAVFVVLIAVAYGNFSESRLDAVESKFRDANDQSLLIRKRQCDGDTFERVCWFTVKITTPGTGCTWDEMLIYKCTTDRCTWLVMP